MAIPVYVQSVTTYPGRTAWDTTGATNYVVGDRVYYDDGTLEKVYVCIVDNASTTTPDNDSTNWVLAGSKEYPFLSGSNGNLYSSGYSDTELCLRNSNGFNTQWDPARTLSISDGSTRAHVILMDGVFNQQGGGSPYLELRDTDFYSENFQKTWWVQHYYDGSSTTENCPTFNNLKLGLLNQQASFEAPLVLNNCLVTTQTPLGNKIKTLHRFQYQDFIKATNCLFDFSLCDNNSFIAGESSGPSALHGPTSFENCTIIFNKGENQYGGLMYAGHSSADTIIDNCIFYFLGEVEQSQPKVVSAGNITVTNTCVFAESFSDQPFIAGTSGVDDSNHLNINPLFIDAAGGDYRLRPSSPLIGGVKAQNDLAEKHPNGVWVDHNHAPTQSAHSYTLDSGDGSSYTVSGDATGSDPTLNVGTRDTLTFANNTGGHPLAIYNSQGHAIASESGSTTTFTPLYPDTYYYQCTTTGHESMRGDIVVTNGTLGSYGNPFVSYHDAIDSGYFDSKLTLLFKEGDHLMSWYAGTTSFNSAGISSAFSDGLYFIGENHKTRLTTGDNFNGYGAFYVTNLAGSAQSNTPLFLKDICIHINNTTSMINRGVFCGSSWKSFSAESLLCTCDLNSSINSNVLDYFASEAPNGFSFKLSGCEFNVPLSDNNGPGSSFLSGANNIIYEVESCTFAKLTGYKYYNNTPSPVMTGGQFGSPNSNGSTVKNCIFYTNTGGDFGSYNPSSGVFSSCVIHSTTNSFIKLPPDMSLNSDTEPLFIGATAGSEDLRLRPSSAAIGGIKAEDNSSVWVTNTAGTGGTGTEEDPYYFGSLDQAYTDAGSFGSIVFKNGSYSVLGVFTFNSDTQANNVNYHAETNGGVEFTAEKILFGHSGLSVTQSLNYTGLKLISTNASVDNFLLNQSINNLVAAHVFASCHLQTNHSFLESNGTSTTPGKVIFRNSRLSKVSATYHSYLFEQRNGNTTPADLSFENCIIENSLSTSNLTKIFRRITATLKSTIIIDYSNSATALAVDPVPVNLVGSNCITHGDGTDLYPNESNIVVDPLFVDPAGGNFSLRPNSPLIGQG